MWSASRCRRVSTVRSPFVGKGKQRGAAVDGIGFAPYKSGRLEPRGAAGDAGAVEPHLGGQVDGTTRPGPGEAAQDRVGQLVDAFPHAGGQPPMQFDAAGSAVSRR